MGPVIKGADLDHVALAAESRAVLEPRYAGQLGGVAIAGGPSPGFVWGQFEYANGMVVELLEPDRIEENDFLRRFLDRSGPGPHHLTFKVPDLRAALGTAGAAGYTPVGMDDTDPRWKEAFLHPKDAPGVVIQLAESHEDHQHPVHEASASAAELVHVGHAVRSLDDGLRLFEGLLGAVRTGEGAARTHRWIDLRWPGPGRVRLLVPTGPGDVDEWLGNRAGRVHHLAFSIPDPASVPDASAHDGHWCVEPEANHGTRLILGTDPATLSASLSL